MKFLFVLRVINKILMVLFRLASPNDKKILKPLQDECLLASAIEAKKEEKDVPKTEEIPYE